MIALDLHNRDPSIFKPQRGDFLKSYHRDTFFKLPSFLIHLKVRTKKLSLVDL